MENLKGKKLLVIVESPNKCAHVREYLQKAGYTVKVMASVGHIMQLADDRKSFKNSGVYVDDGFKLNLKIAESSNRTVEGLKEAVKWADKVALMTDPDREGFLISWSLIKFLKLSKDKYFRAVTHEITPKAVVHAIENPIQMDDNIVDAGLARMTLDKLVGYTLSPLARTYVGAKSVGRCQSVGLKIIADREREIQNFKPEVYFDLYLNFKKNKTNFKAKYVGNAAVGQIDRLKTKEEVKAVIAACTKDYVIEGIDQKQKQESPKPPFNTPSFQQEASQKLGLSVKDAMAVAQKLFEAGRITYMRTDDDEMSPEFIPIIEKYIKATYGAKSYNKPRVGKKTGDEQAGHECLRITDPALTPEILEKNEPNALVCKVYKLIWQRTIASCLPNAIFSETGYLIDNNGQKFLLASKELLSEGYRVVYNYKEDDDDDDGTVVKETFTKGEVLKNTKLEDQKKETKPKPRFSEATLVKELQKQGVGRPSTYASIVETVLSESRGYAKKDGKVIVPTERGMQLSAFLDRNFSNIINIGYTREMEESLDKIANGKLTKSKYLNAFFTDLMESIKNNKETSVFANDDAGTCPQCGAKLVIKRSRFGTLFKACPNYPQCKYAESIKK